MCDHIIQYKLRTDSGRVQTTPVEDGGTLEQTLASLRGNPEVTSITVFSPTRRYDRVPTWIESEPGVKEVVMSTSPLAGPAAPTC